MISVKAAALAAAALSMAGGTTAASATTAAAGPASVRPAAIAFDITTVYALAPDHSYVAQYDGTPGDWTTIGGPARNVYAGGAGVFATNPTTGDIFQYNGTPGSWTQVGGPGSEFAEGGGHLYGVGPSDNYVAEYNGTPGSWTVIESGPIGTVYAGLYGVFAENGTNSDVLKYNGTPGSWTNIGFGPVSNAAVGANGFYAADFGGLDFSQWTSGGGWAQIGPVKPNDIADPIVAGAPGLVIGDQEIPGYYKYNGTPFSWTEISFVGNSFPVAMNYDHLYGTTFSTPSSATVYSGTGMQWTNIGGPANAYLIAGD